MAGWVKSVERAYKRQLRRVRRNVALWQIPFRPAGRRWKSALSYPALESLQKGALQYRYRGLSMLKNPIEVALYYELFWLAKPRTVIEIGSYLGTSAPWFSDILKTFDIDGQVISIDTEVPAPSWRRDNVRFLKGDANALSGVLTETMLAALPRPLLVIEDSTHRPETAVAVLAFFHPHLSSGEFIVIEDALVTDLGVAHHFGGGPGLGISQYLSRHPNDYEIVPDFCDRYGHNVTGNPNGYLRKR